MSKASVTALKERLETMFPGKWLSQTNSHRTVLTGLTQIDQSITHGLQRKRIAEWTGPRSCGKTTVLRSIIRNWCANGFHVAYIDGQNQLIASDWAFVDKTKSDLQNETSNGLNQTTINQQLDLLIKEKSQQGKFWVVRQLKEQDLLWATEQLVRSGIFDIVILDTANSNTFNSRSYARLQRSLDRSKTAFVLLKEEASYGSNSTWGCDSRFTFSWSNEANCKRALSQVVSIQPTIYGSVWRDGLTQDIEVIGSPYVQNRLFTHPQIPDRRTPKARTRS